MWQEASAPGGRFFCGKRVPNRVQALIKLIIFLISSFPFLRSPFFLSLFPFLRSPFFLFFRFSILPSFSSFSRFSVLLSFSFFVSPFSLLSLPFPVSPFSFLSLPFPFLRSPFFLFFRSPLFSCVFLHFVLSAYEKLLCRNKSASLVTV